MTNTKLQKAINKIDKINDEHEYGDNNYLTYQDKMRTILYAEKAKYDKSENELSQQILDYLCKHWIFNN